MTPIFDAAALRKHCDNALAAVPPGHGCARIKVTLPDGRVEVVVASRFHDNWLIQGSVDWKIGTKDWSAACELVASW